MKVFWQALRIALYGFAGLALALTVMALWQHPQGWGWHWREGAFVFGHASDAAQGPPKSEERTLPPFDKIKLETAGEFEVTVGAPQRLSVYAAAQAIERIETRVENGTLIVARSVSTFDRTPRFILSLPALRQVEIDDGGGRFRVHGLNGGTFSLNCDGAADFAADGAVDALDVEVDGAARVDTRALKARTVKVRLDGAGLVKVYASDSLDARLEGLGAIRYAGAPKEVRQAIDGLGKIEAE
ncbi:MAG: DUF2807 domain-containing protein [Sinobacteraceae bacterium]|nr:DUF2807 domain-containing protein [Nevskiaceae bacterium]